MSNGSPGPASATNAWRSLMLAAIGAVVGLLIAGFGLFTAHGTRTAGVPPEDAALVNGVPILAVDYQAQLRTLYDKSWAEATPVERKHALDDMIREELYVQRGIELGMANDDIDVRAALVRSTESQNAADAMAARPSDAELRAWYHDHPALYASEGLLDADDYIAPGRDMARAAALAARLRGGEAPQGLGLKEAATFSDGPQFYFIARLRLGDDLAAQLLRLRPGEVSRPVQRPDGVHIARLRSDSPPQPQTFEDSRAKVLQDFIADKVKRLANGNDRFLRKRADIKIATRYQ